MTRQETKDWARGSFDALQLIALYQNALEEDTDVEWDIGLSAAVKRMSLQLGNILQYCWLQRVGRRIAESLTRLELQLDGYYMRSQNLRGRYRESSVSASRICAMGAQPRKGTDG